MNILENLVLIDGVDRTDDIYYLKNDDNIYDITFKKGEKNKYSLEQVSMENAIRELKPSEVCVLAKGNLLNNISTIVEFPSFFRVFFNSTFYKLYKKEEIEIQKNFLEEVKNDSIFQYHYEMARNMNVVIKDKIIRLSDYYQQLEVIRKDSILLKYLQDKNRLSKQEFKHCIFPFGINNAQLRAVTNAFKYNISVIEGAFGTGKTNTIINIIANAVMYNKSIAVLANDNDIKAIYNKLEEYGISFLAYTGSSQPIPNMEGWLLTNEKFKEKLRIYLKLEIDLKNHLAEQEELMIKTQELEEIKLEYQKIKKIYSEDYKRKGPSFFKADLGHLASSCGTLNEFYFNNKKIPVWFKLIDSYAFGVANYHFYDNEIKKIINFYHSQTLLKAIEDLESRIYYLKTRLQSNGIEELINTCRELSLDMFKHMLALKFKGKIRKNSEYLYDIDKIMEDYPLVLGSPATIGRIIPNMIYDYVIVDEASNVDITSGILAMSVANHFVVIGEDKELSISNELNILNEEVKKNHTVNKNYDFKHSLIKSVKSLSNTPVVTYNEYYINNNFLEKKDDMIDLVIQ